MVVAIACSPDGNQLTMAGDNNALGAWNLNSNRNALSFYGMTFDHDRRFPIEDIPISEGSDWLISIDTECNAHGWPLRVEDLAQCAERRIV